MEIHKILDRFEILYPDNKAIEDLRRAYIDKDLSSIFRLIETHGNVSDLRKIILSDDIWALWRILAKIENTQFITALKSLISVNETPFNEDCMARGQLLSKKWLVEELEALDVDLGTVFLCAGWYGTLATMLFESSLQIDKIRSFDIDPSTPDIAKVFNKPWVMDGWKFQASIDNIHNIDFNNHEYSVLKSDGTEQQLNDVPDTIINTSCEHIENFDEWYAKIQSGKLVILQSNDYFEIDEHINCSKDLEEFVKSAPFEQLLYSGTLELPDYNRFMIIGIK